MRPKTAIRRRKKKCTIYTYFRNEELVHKYTYSDQNDEERKGEASESGPEVPENRDAYITERHDAYVDVVKTLLENGGYVVTMNSRRNWHSNKSVMTTNIEYRLQPKKLSF